MAGSCLVDAGPLTEFIARIVGAMGADAEIAAVVAGHLVRSNLSGHDSHGVLRMPQYMGQIERGELSPGARPVMLSETPVTALMDAGRGFGHYSTARAMDWAVERAREHGLAAAAVRHSGHIGRLGEYTERAAGQGMVAIVTVGASGPGVGGMVLFGGRQRFFGANPWSIGVPAEGRAPMVFDGSTSTVAEGKVRLAHAKGEALPLGCIMDREGRPSTNPADFYAGGALVPLGGEVAGHKGYGLAMASALISGLAMIGDPNPSLIGASVLQEVNDPRGRVAGVFVMAINPAAFGSAGDYRALVAENLAAAKRVRPAEGRAEVLIPGEPEAQMRQRREREGIPLPAATWEDLHRVAERYGVPMPDCRQG